MYLPSAKKECFRTFHVAAASVAQRRYLRQYRLASPKKECFRTFHVATAAVAFGVSGCQNWVSDIVVVTSSLFPLT